MFYYNKYNKYNKKLKRFGGSNSDFFNLNSNKADLERTAKRYGLEDPENYSKVQLIAYITDNSPSSSINDELPLPQFYGNLEKEEFSTSDLSDSEVSIPLRARPPPPRRLRGPPPGPPPPREPVSRPPPPREPGSRPPPPRSDRYSSQGGSDDEEYNGGYRNNYSRDVYNRYEERRRDNYYPRRGGYDGGNFFEKADPVNQVVKELYTRKSGLLTEKIWKSEGKLSRRSVNIYGLPKTNIYFTARYNWNLNGPVLAYVVSIKRDVNTEVGSGNVTNISLEFDPVKLYIVSEGKIIDDYYPDESKLTGLNSLKYYNESHPLGEYLKELLLYIKSDIKEFFPKNGGYNRYEERRRDNYYPRRGGYRDDYYPDSMHGGALGEFRKEINREIV